MGKGGVENEELEKRDGNGRHENGREDAPSTPRAREGASDIGVITARGPSKKVLRKKVLSKNARFEDLDDN